MYQAVRRERDREGDSSLYTVALSASCVYQAVRRERDREGDSSLYTVALSASCVYQAVRREREIGRGTVAYIQ